ncbi:MAG TPA: EAL domain-containing protein [Gallionella sp.]|nr:EAL domain-containing protein [Gallionella sp.]
MPISWNVSLVLLSVLVAMTGSFTALAHAQRMRESSGRAAMWWMAVGGITLGAAIWAMHFIGMLAFHLPVPLAYDPSLTLLSIVPAIAASLLAFRMLRDERIATVRLFVGGLAMGGGIAAMHYIGMDALKMSPPVVYSPLIVALSVAIAVVASWGALLMMYRGERIRLEPLPRSVLGALIMGVAISGMHYTAMQGLQIRPDSLCLSDGWSIEPNILALWVATISLLWFGGGILASMFDQRMAHQNAEALAALERAHEELQQRVAQQAQEMTQSLRESHEVLQRVLDSVAEGIYGVDMEGRCTFINASGLTMLGYADAGELVGKNMHKLTHHTRVDGSFYPARECRMYQAFLAKQEIRVDDEVFWRKDGTSFPVEYWSHPIVKDGEVQGAVATFFDISERKQAEIALARSEMKFRTLYDSTGDAVMLLDQRGFFDCNRAALEMFGCTSMEEFCARHPADLSPPQQPDGSDSALLANRHIATAIEQGSDRFEWMHRRADNGKNFPAEVLLSALELDGRTILQATVRDISERKQTEQQIHQLAFFDALTNLPNRRLLMDRLQQAMAVSARSRQHGAIMFLDLDHFKTLNDTKGHEIGDLLLIEVAQRLSSCVRDGDTVARLGGDEFVVVLEALSSSADKAATQVERVAEKIQAALNEPYQLKGRPHHTTPSIGIAMFKGHRDSVDNLLKYADIAMYQAKTAGRNSIRFYDPETQSAIEARADLETELRLALENRQFQLHYQIQVDSRHRPLGAEVLLRWQHPQRGLVPPMQFIPLAEEAGLIVPIGLWVLQVACAQLKTWQGNALTRDLTLAVNVSAKQFRQADFVARVQRALQESGAKPSLLKLELTESMVQDNLEDTIAKMRELKLLGVSFSMDDFGTGYSSLQYLKQLPLDQIKIDRSFVRDITTDMNDAAIVQTIIAMSDALGLNVIAEGVETGAQCEFLDEHGCHAFQGYLFGKPLPLDQFEASLHREPGQ